MYDREACYEVDLSNGLKIYSDDNRPGLEEPSTWIRLQEYITREQVDITGFRIRFRSNVQHIGYGADGYYFAHASLSHFGDSKSLDYYVVGTLKNHELKVKRFEKPALINMQEDVRNWKEAKQCLIINPSIIRAYLPNQPNT
ncbi:MAG: hypothetical protein EBX50_21535 [Chitinophagia bacterium]|nr:hypothetical protein [Chitinophagia bacterium]